MWLFLVWARLPVFLGGGSMWCLYLLNFYKENDFIYNKQKKKEKSEWVQQVRSRFCILSIPAESFGLG